MKDEKIWFMKKPCAHCPFRSDVRPFLTNERAEELAYHSHNPYNSFACHKTIEHYEDGPFAGEGYETEITKECAGFLTLRASDCGEDEVSEIGYGFVPSYDIVYPSAEDMVWAYEDENAK